jgi:hypothetical protein
MLRGNGWTGVLLIWQLTIELGWLTVGCKRSSRAGSRLAEDDQADLDLSWLNAINPSRFSASWKRSSWAGW